MQSQYKPANYSTVSPYLIVNDADATIDFLKRVFGAIELRKFPDESGKLIHAEVRIDDTVIMLADPVPPDWLPLSSHVHIYVRDVDATYRKAIEAGRSRCRSQSRGRMRTSEAESRSGEVQHGGLPQRLSSSPNRCDKDY